MKQKSESIFALLIVFVFLLGFAIYELYQAQTYSNLSRVNELVAQSTSLRESNFDLSLLLSVEAFHRADTPITRGTLLDSVQTNPQLIRYLSSDIGSSVLAFSPDGELLAVGGKNGTILLWNLKSNTYQGRLIAKWDPPEGFQPKQGEPVLGPVSNLVLIREISYSKYIYNVCGPTYCCDMGSGKWSISINTAARRKISL